MENTIQNINWPGWEIVKKIGSGSFGTVYEIQRDVFDDVEKAALKVISIPQNPGDIEEMYSDGYDEESITSTFHGHLKSIVAEYSLMRKMNGNSNIVNCDDVRYVQHDDGIGWDIFIKMELLTPLTKALPAVISEETVIKLAKDICAALELCKKHDIVHRDIKPQNVFMSPNGDYKLGDFGIAKTVEKTIGGTKIGTYKYMAPEVYNNQPYGSGADIYSLGLVLYWMLNERRMPFMPLPPQKLTAGMDETARYRRFSGEQIPAPAHGSRELQRIVLKACAFDPRERYQSAAQMLEDLNGLKAGAVIPAADTSTDTGAQNTADTAEDDKTVGVLWNTSAATEKAAPKKEAAQLLEEQEKTVGPDFLKTVHKSHNADSAQTAGNKKQLLIGAGVLLGILLVILLLLLRSCGPTQDTSTESSTDSSTAPSVQAAWSQWQDSLPDSVTADVYDIEEQTLYRSRTQEITSSTETSTMEGWELYDTVAAGAGFGEWSKWSEQAVEAADTREVETQTMYRYRDKETTTGSASTMDGWDLYNTTYAWSNYGGWSSWSTSAATASNSRQVETKTQYRARDIWITQEYTGWSDWSNWSTTRQSTGDLKKEESRTVYAYCYFLCPNCGAHMHGWGTCWTWAGGCGAPTNEGHWHEVWSTVSWDEANLRDWHGTGRYYTYIDGELVFKWPSGGSRVEYRYATRSLQNITNYGSWSGWTDASVSATSSREVQTRTVYRYRDRSQVATYHFERWGEWSGWSAEAVAATDTRQVESIPFYRYRDQIITTTYWFRRWTDWSEYGTDAVTPSETTEVETKTQYRYRPKQ